MFATGLNRELEMVSRYGTKKGWHIFVVYNMLPHTNNDPEIQFNLKYHLLQTIVRGNIRCIIMQNVGLPSWKITSNIS